MNTRTIWLTWTLCGGLLAVAAPAAAQEDRDERESYSYVRTIEGPVTVAAPGQGPGEAAEVNQPLLVGDELRLDAGARAEILLADRSLIRLGGGSTLGLDRIAFSADREDRTTSITLAEGEMLLVVTDAALGDQLPEIRTPGATLYVHEPGTYRIEAAGQGWTELVVRAGYAEMLTERGSTIVRAGELARTQGDAWGRVRLAQAGPEDALELWDRELHARAEVAAVSYVEPELAYAAAPLNDYGSWIEVDASWYWRPRVDAGWRPYWQGRWCSTPSGLTWVSYEPWGWVPYHYGTWAMLPGYGWAWRPGYVYSPAWVYWNWGSRWAGWCPIGYYTGFYNPWYHHGYRWGIYGWAGGGWGDYGYWNFVPTYCVRERDWRRHHRTGHDLEREHPGESPHGVITTDTRLITRDRLAHPERIPTELAEHRRRETGADVPDVTDFVARKKVLPPGVIKAIEEPNNPGRLAGTPLAPDTPKAGLASRRPTLEQPWRRGSDDAPVGTVPTRGLGVDTKPRSTPPVRAGSGRPAVEDGSPVKVTPARPATDGDPRARPVATPRTDAPAPAGEARQGWKLKNVPGSGIQPGRADESPTALPRGGSRVDDSAGPGKTPPTASREEPVRRVVGGVRKSPAPSPGSPRQTPAYEPRSSDAPAAPRSASPRSYDTPKAPKAGQPRSYDVPSTPRTSQPRSYNVPSAPRTSQPRTYQAPSTPRTSQPGTYQAPSTPRTYSAPPSTPRSAPRAAAPTTSSPSSPRVAPAPRSGSGSTPKAAPQGSSAGSSKSSQGSSSPKSSKPSTPPPHRGHS